MTRILPLMLLMTGCGDPAVKAWRTLDACAHLTLMERMPPADGGSISFIFRTDADTDFVIKAVHQDVEGNAMYQEVRLLGNSGTAEAEVVPGSALESRLVVLLEACRFDDGLPMKNWAPKPSPATRDWLLGRLKNRDIPWGPCP